MKYPFKFKNWVALTYSNDDIDSYVIKSDDWIVGMGNMMVSEDIKRAHALHIFIDPKFRHKGLATQMLEFLEKKASYCFCDFFHNSLVEVSNFKPEP